MRRTILPLLVFAAAACQPATVETAVQLSAEERAAIAAEVDSVASDWWAAWEAVDFDRGMSFLADAPEAAWAGDDGVLYTVAAMSEAWTPWAEGLQTQSIEFTDARTIVLAPDVVYTIRSYTNVQTHAGGTVAPELRGVETLVWAKRDGTWKVLLGHESMLQESWQARLDYEATLP
jgi:ketosteroid isomerase-like protein